MRLLVLGMVIFMISGLTETGHARCYTADIGRDGDEIFLVHNWYWQEGPYDGYSDFWRDTRARWGAQGAQLRIPVFPGVNNRLELRAHISDAEGQMLTIIVNGRNVGCLPHSEDFLYTVDLSADVIGDSEIALVRLEAVHSLESVPEELRDLRVALDYVKTWSGDREPADYKSAFARELLGDFTSIYKDEAPHKWRFFYDPIDAWNTFSIQRVTETIFDDTRWEVVGTDYAKNDMFRGAVGWYRSYVTLSDVGRRPEKIDLPGDAFLAEGSRQVWVNGALVPGNDQENEVAQRLQQGLNFIVVKVMKGPQPKTTGDKIVQKLGAEAVVKDDGTRMVLRNMVMADGTATNDLTRIALVSPGGITVDDMDFTSGASTEDIGRKRWKFSEYGTYSLEISTRDREQSIPLHHLGLHFFHWGWYSTAGGTVWDGFKPCSNNFIDELFEKLDDWGRPHHSIAWQGVIIEPGYGFHNTQGVDYVKEFAHKFESGKLQFVGSTFAPRNVCTDFGESLLRGMKRSKRLYESQFGLSPSRFTSHDSTLVPTLTQVMNMCGYDTYCIAENWWGQEQSIPNSRDCFWQSNDGTRVRVLDSWYHGIDPVTAAKRAVELGKPAVLCNEEFACLDRTVFLTEESLQEAAGLGIFLHPISLDEYQKIADSFANELVHEGDTGLSYKGWTGGGEGEVEFEKSLRIFEHSLIALDNMQALAKKLSVETDLEFTDDNWNYLLRAHECHNHWVNGHVSLKEEAIRRTTSVNDTIRQLCVEIADRVDVPEKGVLVFNPFTASRDCFGEAEGIPAGTLLERAGKKHAVQPCGDNGVVSIEDLASCGWSFYSISTDEKEQSPKTRVLRSTDGNVTISNDELTVEFDDRGAVSAITDNKTGKVVMEDACKQFFALPEGSTGLGLLSSADNALNDDFYALACANGGPEVVFCSEDCSQIKYTYTLKDYPQLSISAYFTLGSKRELGIRLVYEFSRPTVIAPLGAKPPHEGVYFPGIYLSFPKEKGVGCRADMAYCTTDNAIECTNHKTFMKEPFRNGTFNCLSMCGPSDGSYYLLTKGLHDFFELPDRDLLCMSLGMGPDPVPFHDKYVHEFSIYIPRAGTDDMGARAYKKARANYVECVFVPVETHKGDLPANASLVAVDNPDVYIAGVNIEEDGYSLRIVNITGSAQKVSLSGLFSEHDFNISGSPGGPYKDIVLPPRSVRELHIICD